MGQACPGASGHSAIELWEVCGPAKLGSLPSSIKCSASLSLSASNSIDRIQSGAFLLFCFQVNLQRQTSVGCALSCFSMEHEEGLMESNSSFELNNIFQLGVPLFALILLEVF